VWVLACVGATRGARPYADKAAEMGLLDRFLMIFRARASRALDEAEDPGETLDYSYERQRELLQRVRRGVADVATGKKRLELQAVKLEESVSRLEEQARKAVGAGREDLARAALERKQALQAQLTTLDAQRQQLQGEQDKLILAEQRLTTKVEAFRVRKETVKAQYSAAEAQVQIGEAVTGVSEEMADVGLAIERAEDRTETLRARAGAIDELIESGALEDLTGGDAIDRELSQIEGSGQVERELEQLRRGLGTGSAPPAGSLGAGSGR
jgi:phage shock protein A